MNKYFLYALLLVAIIVSITASGILIPILLLAALAVVKLFPNLRRRLDFNRDGIITLDDFTSRLPFRSHNARQLDTPQSFLQQRMHKVWNQLEHRFVQLSIQVQKRERTARRWWSRMLPPANDQKVTGIIEDLSIALDDRELRSIRTDFMMCVNRINKLDEQLGELRASITMRSEPPDGPLHRSEDKLRQQYGNEGRARTALLQAFQSRMMAYGVNLSEEQAEVLLSRVDAGDVSRMTTIFAIISAITSQFAEAKVQTGENLNVTKKYYGIYLGLLELQMHIQTEYIRKVEREYLPGVQRIGHEAEDLMDETELKLRDSDPLYKEAYQQNLKSQQFTIEVTDIYAAALRADRGKVEEAREIVRKLYDLAENTLSTVRVSADLSALVRQSEGLYKQVMTLQTPALVPFENLQMQKEFQAVTQRLIDS